MISEKWETIPNFPTYSISNFGRVRRDIGGAGTQAGKILRPQLDGRKYHFVSLCKNGVVSQLRIHTLVCTMFNGPQPTPEHEVAHDPDPTRTNNHYTNLKWKTHAENCVDTINHGHSTRGTKHPMVKLTAKLKNRKIKQHDLAIEYSVSDATISLIKSGKVWGWL